ncbi:MAG: hypothetical protein ACXWUG_11790 [Polyangiales bacterium]
MEDPKIEPVHWEKLMFSGGDPTRESVTRMKVFGGWLVRTTNANDVAVTFVPDPRHEWVAALI